jgi:SAM-dependent methyltransferase
MANFNATSRFSSRVGNYVKYRPSYPKELLDFMFRELGLSEGSSIADMGSGTGIFTGLLLERGAKVYAVEPNAEMRAAAEEAYEDRPNFRSVAAPAEKTGLPDAFFDMVCAATAFHWFDAAQAKVEWKRILKPDGVVFLVWNVRRGSSPFLSEYEKMLQRFATGYNEVHHRNSEEDAGVTELFSPQKPRAVSFPNEQVFDFDGLVGRLLSSSYAPLEGQSNHAPMMKELKEIFDRHKRDGKIRFEYDSKAYFGPVLK